VAQRFSALQREYDKAKDVTRLRLYLETMEHVLPRMNKIIMDDVAASRSCPIPLDQIIKPRPRRHEAVMDRRWAHSPAACRARARVEPRRVHGAQWQQAIVVQLGEPVRTVQEPGSTSNCR